MYVAWFSTGLCCAQGSLPHSCFTLVFCSLITVHNLFSRFGFRHVFFSGLVMDGRMFIISRRYRSYIYGVSDLQGFYSVHRISFFTNCFTLHLSRLLPLHTTTILGVLFLYLFSPNFNCSCYFSVLFFGFCFLLFCSVPKGQSIYYFS